MGENEGAGNTWPSSAISDSPEPMPISAVAIGSPMASSEPNAISSTIAAAPTPIPLDGPPYGVSARSTTSPPRLNVTPFPLATAASWISAVASLPGMPDPWTSNWTVAYAMCPSAARCPEPHPQRDQARHPHDPHHRGEPPVPVARRPQPAHSISLEPESLSTSQARAARC